MVLVAVTMNAAALRAMPPAIVTVSGPFSAAGDTVAVICESELIVNVATASRSGTDEKAHVCALVKPVPVMTTVLPTTPLVGEMLAMVGWVTAVVPEASRVFISTLTSGEPTPVHSS